MNSLARFALVVGMLLLSWTPSWGFGWGLFRSRTTTSSYYHTSYAYYPAITYFAAPVVPLTPAVVCPPSMPLTIVQPPRISTLATPTPAPPSQTPEPPVKSGPPRAPKTDESRSFYQTVFNNRAEEVRRTDVCRVGFWNISPRSLTLYVEGQAYSLPAGRAITVSLPRSFTWQVDGGNQQTITVPADRTGHEVVIR